MLDHREFTLILYVTDIVHVGTCTRCYIKVRTICINDSSKYSNGRKATITLSLNTKSKETSVEKDVIGALRNLDYVSKVELISMSM